jgi:hypothetical protein
MIHATSIAEDHRHLGDTTLVTLVLWLPDLWILAHGEPIRGVGVVMTMHLAIAFITYNTLVRIAPVGRSDEPSRIAPRVG